MYGVVWKHEDHGKIMSAPESLDELETADDAKKEGLQMLSELPPEHRSIMKPLSIVEVTEDMIFGLKGCERIFLPNADDDGELEFVNVSSTSFWTNHNWWHK